MNNANTAQLVNEFKLGNIVVFPTDTAYGIGCRMDNKDSVKKIFEIRNRVETKPLLVLCSNMKMVEKYVVLDYQVKELVDSYWPGGVTFILPCRVNEVPGIVRAGGDTLAVRIPKHEVLLDAIAKVGVPVVAPSANISGNKTPYCLEDVEKDILDMADFVFSGQCTYKKESTIVDTTKNPWELVRSGAIEINNL